MAEFTRLVTFSGGQVNPDLLFEGNDLAVNSSPLMKNILFSNDGFRRRSGTIRQRVIDATISNFISVNGALPDSRFVNSGFFIVEDGILFYYDFYLTELFVTIGDANDYTGLRVVRLKDYIIFYNQDNLFYVNVITNAKVDWVVKEDVTIDGEIGVGKTYPSYSKRVYNAHYKIYSRLVRYNENTNEYDLLQYDSSETSSFFQIRVTKGFYKVSFFGAALSTTLINPDIDVKDVLKKTLKQEVLFRVLKVEDSNIEGYELVTCEALESVEGPLLSYVDPPVSNYLDALKIMKDVTELRVFIPPDVMGVIGGRLVAITGNTLCFSEANNPLNFQETLASNDSFDPSSLPTTAYSELFSGVEEDKAIDIVNVNDIVVIVYEDSIRVLTATEGIFSPTNISTVTQKVTGKYLGVVDNLLFLNSRLHVLSHVQWNGRERLFAIQRAFRYDQTTSFNSGVKKVLEVFDGSYMMVLLNNGECLFVVRLENSSRGGINYSIFPMSFGQGVLDIGYYNGLLYLFVLRSDGVSLEVWEPGTGQEYDVKKGDVVGELSFYTYTDRNRNVPKNAIPYIKPLGDLSGAILVYPDGKESIVEVRGSEVGHKGNVYTGLPTRYTLRLRDYNMRLTSLYYTFIFTAGR